MRYIVALCALMLFAGAVFAAQGAHNWRIPGFGQDNTNWVAADGGSSMSSYVYNPDTYTWDEGIPTGTDGFTVEADIEMWMSMAFNAQDIYFHIGADLGDNPTMSANVGGWLSSNNGQYLFVSKPDSQPSADDISKLMFKNNIFGGNTPANVTPIPVKWFCTDSTGEHEMSYSTGGNNGQLYGATWLLDNGATGLHIFNIRCQISPERYQPDGHYEMDPVLAASPIL